MKLPIPIRVPTRYCIASTVTQAQINAGFVTLGEGDGFEDDPQLQPHRLNTPVFANLTLGTLCGQADPITSSLTRLLVDKQLHARIIVACSRIKISRHSRPSPEQAWYLAQMLQVQTQWGEAAFDLVLSRLLRFIDRNVNLAALPNAIELSNGRFYWKLHTRAWNSQTSFQSIGNEWSDTLRSYTAPKTTLGIKSIVKQTIQNLRSAGQFKVPASFQTYRVADRAKRSAEKLGQIPRHSTSVFFSTDYEGVRSGHRPLDSLKSPLQLPHSAPRQDLDKRMQQLVDESMKSYRQKVDEDLNGLRLILDAIVTMVEKQTYTYTEEFKHTQKREAAQKLMLDKIMLSLS